MFSDILEKKGQDIIVKRVTKTTEDEFYQTVSKTTTDVEAKAIIPSRSFHEEDLQPGEVERGETVAYVNCSVSPDDYIVVGGRTYRVKRVGEEGISEDIATYTTNEYVLSASGGTYHVALPYWLTVSSQKVTNTERLRMKIEIYGYADAIPCTVALSFRKTNRDDQLLRLPVV